MSLDTLSSESGSSAEKISVMLVDDSSVIRSALNHILSHDPIIDIVASVSNGEAGVSSAQRMQPDIIILDIEMPIMDGLTAIPLIKEVSPKSKIIMFSSLTEKGAESTIKAFSLGAIECVAKPTSSSLRGQDNYFQEMLIDLIRNLMNRPLPRKVEEVPQNVAPTIDTAQPLGSTPATSTASPALQINIPSYMGKPSIVAIGSSTGGPEALFNVTMHLTDFDVPIVITQHMPTMFTKILAQHIEQKSKIPCCEGEEGMVLEAGHVYVAPGGKHMLFRKGENDQLIVHLDDGAPVNFCKPAVDPMLFSLAEIYGNKILNVILTGMGRDGADGASAIAKLGGHVIAQDKETSVVWGMPGATAEAGACSEILPLDEIGPWVRKAVLG